MNRALVPEHLHAVDEIADAVRLFGDEVSERPVFLGGARLQELRGASNARKRIFDFVGQHCRHRGNRTGGAAVRKLTLDHGGHAALLHHDKNVIQILGEERGENIDRPIRDFRRSEIDFVFIEGSARDPDLIRERRERIGVRQHRVQCTFFKQRFADAEKYLSGEIRKNNAIVAVDDENDVRKTLNKRLEIKRICASGVPFSYLSPASHRVKQMGFR